MNQKEEFYKGLEGIIQGKNQNNVYLNKDVYEQIVEEVKNAKQKQNYKSPLDYRRLKRYDVLVVGKEEKLIHPIIEGSSIKYFVTVEQIFDIIQEAHIITGHGGRNRLIKELNDKYKNVTVEAIMLYLSLCQACQQKLKGKRKGIVVKPILSTELNSRCQVDLIDLQTQPDNEYKFILNYQDHLTKFVVLRPLKTKTASEVATHLLDIFTLLGAPSILQCDNGREFANKIILELTNLWDGIKIVHGKPRHSQSQGSVERANQDVENMLTTWLITNNTTKWSEGLKFIQLMKNKAYHQGIKQTPYEALFGTKMKLGLKTSNLPVDVVSKIENEEQLSQLIEEIESEKVAVDENTIADKSGVLEEFDTNKDSNAEVVAEFVIEDQNSILETVNESLLPNHSVLLDEKRNLIETARQKAMENLKIQADKMLLTSKEKLPPVLVGDNVRVSIPDIDRGKTDPKNLICVILAVDERRQLFLLGNKMGKLKQYYSRHQFSVCQQKFLSIDEVPDSERSVREIISKQSLTGGQGYKKCNCKGKCQSKKCSCKAAEILCNSKCHNSNPCSNKG